MGSDKGLVRSRKLAGTGGINVRLPDSIFRTVSLPARLRRSVQVGRRAVGLRVAAQSLRIENATLWSSVSVQVENQHEAVSPRPGRRTRRFVDCSSPPGEARAAH